MTYAHLKNKTPFSFFLLYLPFIETTNVSDQVTQS